MHTHDLSAWEHDHAFHKGNAAGERSTVAVMWITGVMMMVEILAGWWLNSMALLADGFHMSSHTVAIGLSAFAYASARRHVADRRFAFGTWKVEILGGFASAILLTAFVAVMVAGSVERLLSPQIIDYKDAIAIAAVGLVVNIVSAILLGTAHHHDHDDGRQDHVRGHHHDLNLRSAYIHVMADAATSVFAIVALFCGLQFGWGWLDPIAAMVGAVVIAAWARRLLIDTGAVLLDREMDHPIVGEIHEAILEGGKTRQTCVSDLHVWRVGEASYSCAISIVTHDRELTPETVRKWLAQHEEIVHSTIEIQQCTGS